MDAERCETSRRGSRKLALLSVVLAWGILAAYAADFAAVMMDHLHAKSDTSLFLQGVLAYATPFLVAIILLLRSASAHGTQRIKGRVGQIVLIAVILCVWAFMLGLHIGMHEELAVVKYVARTGHLPSLP